MPDLILLDLMLPGIDGMELCKYAQGQSQDLPHTDRDAYRRGEEVDIVTGLELGADDYVTKPFSPRVLLARSRTVLRKVAAAAGRRRRHPHPPDGNQSRPPRGARGRQADRVDIHRVPAAALLGAAPGWAFSRNQIVDAVKGEDYPVTERSVDVQVVGLRKKLGALTEYIETVRGVGYRFKE